MVHGRYVTVVPGDRDRVPTSFADDAAISGITLPVNTVAFLEGFGFGGSHVFPSDRQVLLLNVWLNVLATPA
jgi:hypothetical protein